nr:hypothetical protein [Thermincola potens]
MAVILAPAITDEAFTVLTTPFNVPGTEPVAVLPAMEGDAV